MLMPRWSVDFGSRTDKPDDGKTPAFIDGIFSLDWGQNPPRAEREVALLIDTEQVKVLDNSTFKASGSIVFRDGLALMTDETLQELLTNPERRKYVLHHLVDRIT